MVTALWWILFIVIGIPMLLTGISLMLARFVVKMNETAGATEFSTIPPEQVSGIPARKLRKKMEAVKALGFRELYAYTLLKGAESGMRNYVFVLVPPDERSYIEVYYIRAPWLFRIITLLFDRKHFHFSVLSYSCISAWTDNSRLATSGTRHTIQDMNPNDVSEAIERVSFDNLFRRHQEKLDDLIRERGDCRRFASLEDYLSFYKARSAFAAAQIPSTVEEVFEQNAYEPD